MDLTILDTSLEPISIFDTYTSLIWTDRYYEYGDFELCTAVGDGISDNLCQDYYMQRPDSEHTMIIEKLLIEHDAEDGDSLTVTGRSLESILSRRIIWKQTTVSGDFQNAIKKLLTENVISPSDADRKIDNFIFEESSDPAITGLTIEAQYTGDDLYEVISTLCQERGLGFKVVLNDNKQFVFSLYSGVDRSYAQEANPHVVFSENFDNIIKCNYVESKSTLKNVTLVGGEGEGSERVYTTVGSASGLDRRELFTDARDISSDVGDDTVLSATEYESLLQQRGSENLADNVETISFEGEVNNVDTFVYGVDFFNGDIVQMEDGYGHQNPVRIIESVYSDDTEGVSFYQTYKTEA